MKSKSKLKRKSKTEVKKTAAKKTAVRKPSKKRAPSPDRSAAEAFGKKVAAEYGPVTTVRAVTQKFPTLQRADVLAIASKLKINQFTASGQYQAARSGKVKIDLAAL